jgi:hypothetical protein
MFQEIQWVYLLNKHEIYLVDGSSTCILYIGQPVAEGWWKWGLLDLYPVCDMHIF